MAAHAKLSASGSSIWLNCTKSGELSQTSAAVPRKDTVYTIEGTAAHELAEECLKTGKNPDFYLGLDFQSVTVTREMADGVSVFVDFCRNITNSGTVLFSAIEQTVSLNDLWPGGKSPSDLFGTADFIAYLKATSCLHVVDLKYGKGVAVEVIENTQLRYYGLGALLKCLAEGHLMPTWVEMTIIQPRAAHVEGPVRSWKVPALDLLLWGEDVIVPTVERILSGNGVYKTGPHCRWCEVAGRCPALRKAALQAAKTQFDDVSATPPDVNTIPLDELGEVLKQAEIIAAWVAQVRAAVSHAIDTGKKVSGWKLVEKRATRKWEDEQAVLDLLSEHFGDKGVQAFTSSKLKSVAQIEKELKSYGTEFEDFGLDRLITKESSGTTLVPDEDNRAAVATGPQHDFDDVDL